MIIPKDERSAGATEAGVPEFMDFMMLDQPAGRCRCAADWRGSTKNANSRFNTAFRACTEPQRTAILDDISGLEPPSPDLSHGVAFFRSFRDLTATGFWSSKIGIEDLQFTGNVFVTDWKGCPGSLAETRPRIRPQKTTAEERQQNSVLVCVNHG